jgi:hypothetical protein
MPVPSFGIRRLLLDFLLATNKSFLFVSFLVQAEITGVMLCFWFSFLLNVNFAIIIISFVNHFLII